MFSPNSDPWVFKANNEREDAFVGPLKEPLMDRDYSSHMNPPPKRGKYSRIVEYDDDGTTETTSAEPKDWKQCEYVSNRTRLRCKNIRRPEQLKDYGFCEEHQGYIERIRQEGLRAKHCFDPSFNFCQNFHDLISNDDDETLLPRQPDGFPFVYESMYADNRIDNDDNPLRRANMFTRKDIAKEYINALHRHDNSIQQMRIIYREKHRRTLRQIAAISGKARQTKLDPIKEASKIQRLLAIRRYLLKNHNWERVFEEKLATSEEMASRLAIRREKWLKQLDTPMEEDETEVQLVVSEMVNLVAELDGSDEDLMAGKMREIRRKKFMNPEWLVPPLNKNIVRILELFRQHSKEVKEEKLLSTVKCLPVVQQIQASEQQSSSKNISPPPPMDMAPSSPSRPSSVDSAKQATDKIRSGSQINNNLAWNGQKPIADPHGYLPDERLSILRPSTSASVATTSNHNGKNIIPIAIDDDLGAEMFLQVSYPHLVNEPLQRGVGTRRGRKSAEEKDTEVCARINQPWDGMRNKGNNSVSKQQLKKLADNHSFVPPLRNNQQFEGTSNEHQQQSIKKNQSVPTRDNINNYGSYHQYLSMQRLIPASTTITSATIPTTSPPSQLNHQTQRITRQQFHHPGQQQQPMYGANYGSIPRQQQPRQASVRMRGGIRSGAIATTIRLPPPINQNHLFEQTSPKNATGRKQRKEAFQHCYSPQNQNKFRRC